MGTVLALHYVTCNRGTVPLFRNMKQCVRRVDYCTLEKISANKLTENIDNGFWNDYILNILNIIY